MHFSFYTILDLGILIGGTSTWVIVNSEASDCEEFTYRSCFPIFAGDFEKGAFITLQT